MTGIEIAMAAVTIASSAASAMGSMQQAQQQAALSRYNAQSMRNAAESARLRAKASSDRRERELKKAAARNIANFGASGIDMAGSPVEFLADQAAEAELDTLLIEYGGELEAQGYETKATQFGFQADATEAGAPLTAAGILIGGAAKAGAPFLKSAKVSTPGRPKVNYGGSYDPARIWTNA